MECWSNEILCDVSALNIDSASFTQIYEACGGDLDKTGQMILDIVAQRGKMQNPVTGSGGMFIGTVREIGEDLADKIDLRVGDRIASLVSLSLTPLKINRIKAIHPEIDRVLMLTTDQCSMYCRHCTRRRFAGQHDTSVPVEQIDQCIAYIRETPAVRDVLLSGGDVLMLSDEMLEYIISRLREIPHVEIIRLGSRTPVVCPQRITPKLCAMLKKYHPVWLNTHFNHPKEITREAAEACARLADAGVPLGNQSVLLAGVNDCVHTMKKLVQMLAQIRVRPYYERRQGADVLYPAGKGRRQGGRRRGAAGPEDGDRRSQRGPAPEAGRGLYLLRGLRRHHPQRQL
ncbi:MAG TPA: KamA family radical SAM protein [Candidatus Intestinimonas merdavium]|uniref:KamA family radical SAM protein n=1 Tax=Candidatus Intestinimonas merdavium TaxID=2838622 RepID=A0A9D2CFJ0_9FIRM|nr:KamA family radical SAM protein [Candidatus Intestinimonas merdavium]